MRRLALRPRPLLSRSPSTRHPSSRAAVEYVELEVINLGGLRGFLTINADNGTGKDKAVIVSLLLLQGKNRQGQQQQNAQHHRGYGHHMPPMQPAMGHHGMPPGYPHAYGVEADPMSMCGRHVTYPLLIVLAASVSSCA